ncbi:hypothetical protein BO85DRAFT_245796 [Aspergillus piperis CBS 112811]|uniref:Uncharacterized protein n=1 Tax=Aspergillus piperis CBS 112811 TaxID=1448313 RepID=A0A8G1VRA6_9EURO|nr:hypothetical protein BO85DRAFT_245796 [Aspergillus piperis CBS 112811]RAH59588.1 hypothetical protein BO85DRAFT_245796 [Aspergillus piperis CBS 112811]
MEFGGVSFLLDLRPGARNYLPTYLLALLCLIQFTYYINTYLFLTIPSLLLFSLYLGFKLPAALHSVSNYSVLRYRYAMLRFASCLSSQNLGYSCDIRIPFPPLSWLPQF